jgi:hypothetical protein
VNRSDATLIDGLARALLGTAEAFEHGAHWHAAVLWPDPERHWSSVFQILRDSLRGRGIALYRLGPYAPGAGTGPAIWLRCLLDAELEGASPAPNEVPVFLLPDISSQALRTPQTLATELQPLVELQYRGEVFRNRRQGRDWTVGTFLRSPEQGLGIDTDSSVRTDEAALRALTALLSQPLIYLPAKMLGAEDFDRLIVTDDVRDLLVWISDPNKARGAKSDSEWSAFRGLVQKRYGIDLEGKGALQLVVEELVKGEGAWVGVRSRVEDNPMTWRGVCERMRAAEPKQQGLFEDPMPGTAADTAHQEKVLASELDAVADLPQHEAAGRVISLEERHRGRRSTLWAKLGEAPLAQVLEPLARLAGSMQHFVSGNDVLGIAQSYADDGHSVDAALIDALALAGPHEALVATVARALYLPWAEALANRFRHAVMEAGSSIRPQPPVIEPGTCILFVDGLRYDIGRRLADRLRENDSVRLSWRLAPVPTITATAKPLITPVADAVAGRGKLDAFLPLESSSGQPATTDRLVRAMQARGIQVLSGNETSGPSTPAAIGWAECGNLDKDGHHMGTRLASQIASEIDRIAQRVDALRRAGWSRVRILTDHGWLLIPGGLPKATIAGSIVETAWSRVARLADGAAPEATVLPWHYDDTIRIAVPPGVCAFRAGEAYAHGGISPQECVVPDILVGEDSGRASASARLESLSWKRWKLSVVLSGNWADHEVEVRRTERDPASRLSTEMLGRDENRIDLRVDPDIDEETPVTVVLLDAFGTVVDARSTRIGDR